MSAVVRSDRPMSTMVRTVLSALTLVAGAAAAGGDGLGPAAGVPAPAVADAGTYWSPVAGALRVVRRFDPPAGAYAPGHRGVDLATETGETVRAPARGTVSFAGTVAGRGVVVVMHGDGVRTEYEPVVPAVRGGQLVGPGQPLGIISGTHAGCGAGRCLHWGARRGAEYFDPLLLLRPLGVVHLVPVAQ